MAPRRKEPDDHTQRFRLLAALVWLQPKHSITISRETWDSLPATEEFTLSRVDQADGTVKLVAKRKPIKPLPNG